METASASQYRPLARAEVRKIDAEGKRALCIVRDIHLLARAYKQKVMAVDGKKLQGVSEGANHFFGGISVCRVTLLPKNMGQKDTSIVRRTNRNRDRKLAGQIASLSVEFKAVV